MKPLLLTILISLSLTAFAQEPQIDPVEFGIVYVGMPRDDLKKAGYDEFSLKEHTKINNEERIIYLNWGNPNSDRVTLWIVDDKVKGWRELYDKRRENIWKEF